MITSNFIVEDYISAHRLHHQQTRKVFPIIAVAILGVGILLAFWGSTFLASIAIFGGIGGLLGNWWDERVGLPDKARKLYGQFKGISEPYEMSWNADYLESRNANGQGKRKWKDYVRFKENEDVFLLYITDQLWEAIPKRCFESASQLEEFRQLASTAGEM